jgi:hypothetical protein
MMVVAPVVIRRGMVVVAPVIMRPVVVGVTMRPVYRVGIMRPDHGRRNHYSSGVGRNQVGRNLPRGYSAVSVYVEFAETLRRPRILVESNHAVSIHVIGPDKVAGMRCGAKSCNNQDSWKKFHGLTLQEDIRVELSPP